MPFTFSHPLYAAPLRRLLPGLSMTGLVLGSMIPDMEYFVAMNSYRSIGHSLSGFFLLGLPLSLAAAAAWSQVMKPVLPHLLPSLGGLDRYAAARLEASRFRFGRPAGWLWFLASLFIGFLTHLFVDGMTHTNGWLTVRHPQELYRQLAGLPLYKWMQYGLSLLGLLVPALWLMADYARWRRRGGMERSSRRSLPKLGARLVFVAAAMPLFFGKLLFEAGADNIVLWLVAGCSSALFGLFAAGLFRPRAGNRSWAGAAGGVLLLYLLIAGFKLYRMTEAAFPSNWGASVSAWVLFIWLLSLSVWLLSGGRGRDSDTAVQGSLDLPR